MRKVGIAKAKKIAAQYILHLALVLNVFCFVLYIGNTLYQGFE